MPFITEELWHSLGYCKPEESIMKAPWPAGYTDAEAKAWGLTEDIIATVEQKRELITAGRSLRSEYTIAPSKTVRFIIQAHDAAAAETLKKEIDSLKTLLKADPVDIEVGSRVAQIYNHQTDPVENLYCGQFQNDKQRK